MQKVIFYIIVFLLATGCSVSKRIGEVKEETSADFKSLLFNNNISNKSFNISKAELVIKSKDNTNKFLVNIRYNEKKEFLLSIKNLTGIEGLRIYICSDSIKILDRINRTYYLGRSEYLEKKYGLRKEILNCLFGDFIFSEDYLYFNDCDNNKAAVKSVVKNLTLNYYVSCNIKKVINCKLTDYRGDIFSVLSFSRFKTAKSFTYPQRGIIELLNPEVSIEFNIKRIEPEENGTFVLVPGRNYKIVNL